MAGLAIDNVFLVHKLRSDGKYPPLKVHFLTAI